WRDEYQFERRDGSFAFVLDRGQILRDASGTPVRMIGTIVDITPRKQAEEALVEANRLKDQFLATVSHELRTPLSAIIGWSRLLRNNPKRDSAMIERALEVIERNVRTQTHLIEDLLDISRIISGKLRLDIQLIDPAPIIETAIDTVQPAADAKHIRIQQ